MSARVFITKADGTREPFQVGKLRFSLERAGASEEAIERVVQKISHEVTNSSTTHEIYEKAFSLLKKEKQAVASRYSLKRAVLDLGPTGFPFEKFVARLFEKTGYVTETGALLRGRCTTHEVDLVARRPGRCLVAELKFHNAPGMKSDVQVALYVYARFDDLNEGRKKAQSCDVTHGVIITNTAFTTNAREYAECVGLELISWSYPKAGNLQDLIEEARIHPVTCLSVLSKAQRQLLLDRGVILCSDISKTPSVLQEIGLSAAKKNAVMTELSALCQ